MTKPKQKHPKAHKPQVHKTKVAPASKLKAAPELPKPWMRISEMTLAHSRLKKRDIPVAFGVPQFPPSVTKRIPKAEMALDDQIISANAWAAEQVYSGAFFNGTTFLGYTYLSELAQVPEYRRPTEVLATEMTRRWITLQSASTTTSKPVLLDPVEQAQAEIDAKTETDAKAERIKQLTQKMEELDVQGRFRKMVENDGFFGRSHLFLDMGALDDQELQTPIGNGRNAFTKAKVTIGSLKRLQPVEPVWCYPADYNANDPLKPDWYNPQSWFVQGKKVHASRLLTFVGREVPDMLKPAYSFGGLSLSQMIKPYVDNWLRTRQAVADLIWSFSVSGIKTQLGDWLADGGNEMFKRSELFNNVRNNRGMMLLDKDTEEFFNITTPLSTLDALQAQTQEHMCSVSGTPVVILLGIQPAGLNASSEGELKAWHNWVESFQEKFFTEKLKRVIDFIMITLWGEIDPDITFVYESLYTVDEKGRAEIKKIEAETDDIHIASGVLDPAEVRKKLAADPDSGYNNINVDDVPEPPQTEGAGIDVSGHARVDDAGKPVEGEPTEGEPTEAKPGVADAGAKKPKVTEQKVAA